MGWGAWGAQHGNGASSPFPGAACSHVSTHSACAMENPQHTAGKTLLESVQLGDIPGIGMVMIDGLVRCARSRNTPPATEVPVVL